MSESDRSKIIETMARGIAARRNAALASNKHWATEVAHYQRMVAEYGDAYTKGRSTMTDAFEGAESAFTALEASGRAVVAGWQPIESAPKDGRLALVYRPLAQESGDEPIAIKRLTGGDGHCWPCTVPEGATPTNPTDGSCHVTHWQPLPASPYGKAVVQEASAERSGAHSPYGKESVKEKKDG